MDSLKYAIDSRKGNIIGNSLGMVNMDINSDKFKRQHDRIKYLYDRYESQPRFNYLATFYNASVDILELIRNITEDNHTEQSLHIYKKCNELENYIKDKKESRYYRELIAYINNLRSITTKKDLYYDKINEKSKEAMNMIQNETMLDEMAKLDKKFLKIKYNKGGRRTRKRRANRQSKKKYKLH